MRYEDLSIPALFEAAELVGKVVGHGSDQDGGTGRNLDAGQVLAQVLARHCQPARIYPIPRVIRHALGETAKEVTPDGAGASAVDAPQGFRLRKGQDLDSQSGGKRFGDLLVIGHLHRVPEVGRKLIRLDGRGAGRTELIENAQAADDTR